MIGNLAPKRLMRHGSTSSANNLISPKGPKGRQTLDLSDDSGYSIRDSDLAFLSITRDAVIAMQGHRVPLGMTTAEFEYFCDSLRNAVKQDGIEDIGIRLQGSSARFFGGAHKKMSYEPVGIVQDFELERDRLPQPTELTQIAERLNTTWPNSPNRPLRRPFDAYYKLGIARVGSDYDIQISSNTLANRARERVEALHLGAEYETRHATYRFIKKGIIFEVAPRLELWRSRLSDILRRTVTIAVFPRSGPDYLADNPLLSSHHKSSDWIIMTADSDD